MPAGASLPCFNLDGLVGCVAASGSGVGLRTVQDDVSRRTGSVGWHAVDQVEPAPTPEISPASLDGVRFRHCHIRAWNNEGLQVDDGTSVLLLGTHG